jgi:flagellar biosynthesis GTPase FlhF
MAQQWCTEEKSAAQQARLMQEDARAWLQRYRRREYVHNPHTGAGESKTIPSQHESNTQERGVTIARLVGDAGVAKTTGRCLHRREECSTADAAAQMERGDGYACIELG